MSAAIRVGTRLICVVLALSGCGDSTETAKNDPSPSPSVWVGEVDTLGIGAAPEFPDALDGWKGEEEWSQTVRAFTDTWSPMASAQNDDYPATMNGCDSALSLVRWRVLGEGETVRASWQAATAAEGVAMGDALTGDRGWLILDGCQVPQFQFGRADSEANLTDVAVSARVYRPTG